MISKSDCAALKPSCARCNAPSSWGGDGRFFERSDLADGSTSPPDMDSELRSRIAAIERRLEQLAKRSEATSETVNTLEARLASLDGSVGVMEAAGEASAGRPAPLIGSLRDAHRVTVEGGAQRLAAVQAITKPQTDDPGDDEYSYGFRLWDAGFYPEARQQLAYFVESHPDHPRLSYGRNLLGRAYLDDGKPDEAARWFVGNYLNDRNGARAPDSLLFLAEAMMAKGDERRACLALDELSETYPALVTGRLADQYMQNLRKVTCE